MKPKMRPPVRLGALVLFGVASASIGGFVYQIGLIILSRSSIATAIFSFSYLLFTIPAGVIIGVIAALFAGAAGMTMPASESRAIGSALVGGAASFGAAVTAELISIPLYVSVPPLLPSIVVGALAGIAFGLYARYSLKD